LQPFRPYLIYNNDSTKAIDFVSHHYVFAKGKGLQTGDPDSEVALLDFVRGSRKRLVFTGPSMSILDAAWLQDGSVMIAGAEDAGDGGVRPVIWHFAPRQKMFYTYPQTVQADVNEYTNRMIRRGAARTSRDF
jgi:hypothetical protein